MKYIVLLFALTAGCTIVVHADAPPCNEWEVEDAGIKVFADKCGGIGCCFCSLANGEVKGYTCK